jgi:SAM-dependent methyltransferase
MKLAGGDGDRVRVNWVAESLKKIPRGSRILDAGAGEQRLKPFCKHLDYVSQDFCQYDGLGDGTSLHGGAWNTNNIDIVSNITSIPVPDDSFDAILCSEVFEHIPDPILAIKEFARILKPGGTLLITAPFCSLTHMAPFHFLGLNRYWYELHLPSMGLEICEIQSNGNWFEFIGQELSRTRYVSSAYSSSILGWLVLAVSYPMRALLGALSERDRGSNELLCYGFMIRGKKLSLSLSKM